MLLGAVLALGLIRVSEPGVADGLRVPARVPFEGPTPGRLAGPDSRERGWWIPPPDHLRRALRRDVLWELGRFEVDGPPLVPEPAGRGAVVESNVITLLYRLVSIGTACPPIPARLSVHQGGTRVEARWWKCAGLPRGAELTGVIEGVSGAWLDGVFQAPGLGRRRFHARLVTCDEFETFRAGDADCDPIARFTLDFQRWRGLFLARAYPLGFVPKNAIANALGQLQVAPIYRHPWANLGPAPIVTQGIGQPGESGKVEAVAADPTKADHWLLGAAGGGLWETFDAGAHWAPRTDDQPSLAVPAIAFAPGMPSVVYAGSGDSGIATSGWGIQGAGVLRSADGGTTWTRLGSSTFEGLSVVALQVSPGDPDVVVAAAGGAAYSLLGRYLPPGTSAQGVYRTATGGTSWTLRLAGAATDVVAHPTDFSRQYAGVRTSVPPGSGSLADVDFGGVFRSFDGGQTWSAVEGPWSAAFSRGEIRVAVAPSNPDVVYVSVRKGPFESGADQLLGLWVTENAWDESPAWDQVPWTEDNVGYLAGRPSHMILVDPSDPSTVYATGFHLWKYSDGTWTDLSGQAIHVDQNALAWAGSRLLVGNDGGLFSEDESGDGAWTSHNTDLSITQLYHGSAHPLAPGQMLAGAQDNGVLQRIPFLPNAWVRLFGGDGFGALPGDQAQDWAWWVNGLNVFRSTSGGPFSGGVTSADIADLTGMIPLAAPMVRCPATANTLVGGAKHLWRTDNFFSAPTTAGVHWSQNSPAVDTSGNQLQGFVSAIAFAPSDPTCKTYAFGSDKGLLRLTKDGGTIWTDLDPTGGVPNRYVTGLAFSPASASTLYVTLGGFDEGTPGQPGHVFRTDSALAASPAWANVSPAVNIPHDAVAIHPTNPAAVYVGTDLGVWVSGDGGTTWAHATPAEGLPNVPVLHIEADACGVTAYTFGRGIFRASVPFVCP